MKARVHRNVRNNNPGNIEHGADWNGLAEVQLDSRFCTFISPEYGFRAMIKIMHTYKRKYGLDTIEKVIYRWAPPVENDTDAYVDFVQRNCSITKNDTIEDYPEVAAAMARMEGWPTIDIELARKGEELI